MAEATSLSRVERWGVAVVATLVMAVSYLDRQTLAVLGESVTKALRLENEEYFGWLASAFSIAYLCAAPVAGTVVDRFGARRGLVAAILVWSAVSAAHALAPTFGVLFALRIALGASEAPSFPGAAQAIRRVMLPGERSVAFGMLFTGSFFGAMIAGPLAIALKVHLGGWQMAFVGTAVLGLLWVPLWLAVTHPRRVRAALARVDDAPKRAAQSRLAVLGHPAVLRAIVLVMASAPTIAFVLIWLPKLLQRRYGMSENDTSAYVWVPPLCFDVGAVGFGAIASFRERRAARGEVRSHADLIGIAALLASALVFVPLAAEPWTAVVIAGVAVLGGGGLYARLTADMLARVDPAHVSMAGGLTAAAQSLAYVIANPLVGKSYDLSGSYAIALVVLGALNIPGAVAWMMWPASGRPVDGVREV